VDKCQPTCPLKVMSGAQTPAPPPEVFASVAPMTCGGAGLMNIGVPGEDPVSGIGVCLRMGRDKPQLFLLDPIQALGVMETLGTALAEFVGSRQHLAGLLADEPVETK